MTVPFEMERGKEKLEKQVTLIAVPVHVKAHQSLSTALH